MIIANPSPRLKQRGGFGGHQRQSVEEPQQDNTHSLASKMARVSLAIIAILSVISLVAGSNPPIYETHRIPTPVVTPQVTETVRRTETVTHTFRVTTTSDIWVTESTLVEIPVTVYTTNRNFVPDAPRTITSVLTVTTTPVFVKTALEFINPARTFVSLYTSFVTTTEVIEFWQSIIHTDTRFDVQTVPVWTTQELVQHVTRTTTQYRTQHVTSTTQGYRPY